MASNSHLKQRSSALRAAALLGIGLVALSAGGCLRRTPDVTGSIGSPAQAAALRGQTEQLARAYEANPTDPETAMAYARALRALDQSTQAVAVLQQAAIRNPKNTTLLGTYGKTLADVGRFREASEVLARAHSPDRPDWRILSVQGAVADQMGEHERARKFYDAALKIVPGEPSVMSNLGLSLALSRKLPEAERTLAAAAANPKADARVRQNLALVLGLQGKLDEAEQVLRRDLSPAEADANMKLLRAMITQPNSWAAIKASDKPARATPRS